MTEIHETHRWRGVIALALVAGAAGLLARRPDLLLLAVLGVAYAAYPQVTPTPGPELSLDLDRRVSTDAPGHGEPVEVTVTVQNEGDRTLFDLRLVDGVPPALSVTDGSPRRGMALRPGDTETFAYTVEARRGTHHFEPATVVARDLSGAHELETTVAAETDLTVTGERSAAPLRAQTLDTVGQLVANQGGTGIEFYRTRDYQRGDAMSRIDWNRYARQGELTTVEFREEQAATVVLLVDARASAYRGIPNEPHAVSASITAAEQLLQSLLGRRNQVGLAAFGRDHCWVPPGAGRDHRVRVQSMLKTHPTFASTPPGEEPDLTTQVATLRSRLPSAAQLVLLSPLCDDEIVTAARTLDAHGHAVTVIAPAVTGEETSGQRLAGIERTNRVRLLRQADIPVVEWPAGRSLAAAIDTAREVGTA